MTERTNADWLTLLSNRDDRTVAELRNALARGLVKVLAGRVDQSVADDFAQDAVLKVLSNLAAFRGESKFMTWAMAVATRVAFTELRKARYRDTSLNNEAIPEPAVETKPTDEGEKDAVVATLRRLISTVLTDKQRAVIEGELSGVPIAVLIERFGTNRNAVYKLGHDARMKLKQALEEEGITAEEVRATFAAASN